MAYYRDVSIVDIKDWKLGLEDAFQFEDGTLIQKDLTMTPNRKRQFFKTLYPIVQTDRGYQKLIKKTDKIVTRLNGRRFVIPQEELENYYYHDSGMFSPDLERHAEFEYLVNTFCKVREDLKTVKKRLKAGTSLENKIEDMLDTCENLTINLKSKTNNFIKRFKCGCKNE